MPEPDDEALTCPHCGEVTKDGEYCPECQANEDFGYKYGR